MFPRIALPILVSLTLLTLAPIPVLVRPTAISAATAPAPPEAKRTSWTMFGGRPSRNMVNFIDKNILDDFDPDPENQRGILWTAALGSRSYTSPVISGGKIFIGTNNERPRNPRDTVTTAMGEVEPKDKGILMCFDERTGKFLWQAVHDKLEAGQVQDWPKEGIASTPTVEGNRVYYVSNRAEVMCIDANGFANGNDGFQGEKYKDDTDADVIWSFNMLKELDVFPHNLAMCPPLVVGDIVFVVTGNGVDESHLNIPAPNAPSFIAIDKNTGKLRWKDSSPGKNIMHGQWGIPSYTDDPVPQVIFPGGDGWLRAFDPPTGKLLWKFDCNPKDSIYELGGTGTKSDFVNCAAVIAGGRAFIAVGQDPEHTTGIGHLWCIDLKRAVEFGKTNKDADVTPVKDNFDPKAEINKRSALAWHFGGEDTRPGVSRDFTFGRSMSGACVVGDVLYIAEIFGYVHCFDARTGKRYWYYDTKASIWGTPYFVDGKVYLGNDQGDLFIFRHREEPETYIDPEEPVTRMPQWDIFRKWARTLRKERVKTIAHNVILRKIEMDASIRTTVAAASGVLYVNTEKTLYAIGKR